ncbi:MAG: TIGR00730 family Rossman fold protein [Bacteriovoracaceae bacterium]
MKICIFCGAASGNNPKHLEASRDLMNLFHQKKIDLVYGGAAIGVMGELANTLMSIGGNVYGIIPQRLMNKEVAHPGLTKIHVVKDMHERKKMMYDISDGFLIYPGGLGTMDELFEILTWRQLGYHQKPIALYNSDGYYDPLLSFIDHAVKEGFVSPAHRELLYVSTSMTDIINYFEQNQKT